MICDEAGYALQSGVEGELNLSMYDGMSAYEHTTNSITVLHHQPTGSRTSVLRHQCYQYHYICIDYIYCYYTIRASALQTRRDYIYCYYIYCYYTTRASAFTVTTFTVTTLSACSLMFVTQSTTIVIHNACSYMSAVQTACTKHVHASCIIG